MIFCVPILLLLYDFKVYCNSVLKLINANVHTDPTPSWTARECCECHSLHKKYPVPSNFVPIDEKQAVVYVEVTRLTPDPSRPLETKYKPVGFHFRGVL